MELFERRRVDTTSHFSMMRGVNKLFEYCIGMSRTARQQPYVTFVTVHNAILGVALSKTRASRPQTFALRFAAGFLTGMAHPIGLPNNSAQTWR